MLMDAKQTHKTYSLAEKTVWVAGHTGMVGAALCRRLQKEQAEIITISHNELDLTRQHDVEDWLAEKKPHAIFLAAAKVGGIYANDTLPAQFIYDNIMIEANVMHAAYRNDVEKLLFLASSCIYPKACPQPMKEAYLLQGALEPTNQWYALAKIAGIKLCQAYRQQYGCAFISTLPSNLYGPGDNYHPLYSHVPAGLILRFHQAKIAQQPSVTIWGTGTPRREFLHVDDLADACVFLMQHYNDAMPVNVGTAKDISIKEFASIVADVIDYKGSIEYDFNKT